MSFQSGSITFRRFRVIDGPFAIEPTMIDKLAAHALLHPYPGLPDDVTVVTRVDYGPDVKPRDNWHDIGWLNLADIKDLVRWYEATYTKEDGEYGTVECERGCWGLEGEFDFVLNNGWASIPNNYIEDARFVFWFDN